MYFTLSKSISKLKMHLINKYFGIAKNSTALNQHSVAGLSLAGTRQRPEVCRQLEVEIQICDCKQLKINRSVYLLSTISTFLHHDHQRIEKSCNFDLLFLPQIIPSLSSEDAWVTFLFALRFELSTGVPKFSGSVRGS